MRINILFKILIYHHVLSEVCSKEAPYLARSEVVAARFDFGQFNRISIRSQFLDFYVKTSNEERISYVKQQFWDREEKGEQIFAFYQDLDLKLDRSNDFTFKIKQNSELLIQNSNIFFKIIPKVSVESFTGAMCIYATPFRFSTIYNPNPDPAPLLESPIVVDEGSRLSVNCLVLDMPTQWVSQYNWEGIAYYFFGIIKILANLLMIGITFGKPFLPEKAKLHVSWIAQSIIYWQFFMYTGYITGLFGGVINQIQNGIIKTSTKYFFLDLQPNFNKEFLKRIFGFPVYKYFDNDIYPALTEEMFFEITLLVINPNFEIRK